MLEFPFFNYILYAVLIWSIHLICFKVITNILVRICILESLFWCNIPMMESARLSTENYMVYNIGIYFFLANCIYFMLLWFYQNKTKCGYFQIFGVYVLLCALQILQLLGDFGVFLIIGIKHFNPIEAPWLSFLDGICWTYVRQVQLGLAFLGWSLIILINQYFFTKKQKQKEKRLDYEGRENA